MNIILVIIDTLRQDHVGAYGNDWIRTPNLDKFAKEALVFNNCYPESLPTLPVRRALFTGMRTFPFHGHRDFKGDFSGAPGWGPIPEEQDTLAEILSGADYCTAFFTDTYHMFKPSKNFHRGFMEWRWIRGQEFDRYRSGPEIPDSKIKGHIKGKLEDYPMLVNMLRQYFKNNADRSREKDYFPARVFGEAGRWIGENKKAEKFFLVVDSFDPHEPWDPPLQYRRLYDKDDETADIIHSIYKPWKGVFTSREMKRLQANYAGEVTLVDKWFGCFVEAVQKSGRMDETVIAVISDHGHNLGYDPQDKGLVSKQGHPMTHAVADLVLMIRHPRGEGAGKKSGVLIYNHDLPATLLSLAGITPAQKMDGLDFWKDGLADRGGREYVTIAWGPLVTVVDNEWWYNASIWGEEPLLYKSSDQKLENNLAGRYPDVCQKMRKRAVADAGGKIPDEFASYHSRPGCTPYLAKEI